MHFHGPIVRPQTDVDSLFIEVTAGCSHNTAPLEQIEAELQEA